MESKRRVGRPKEFKKLVQSNLRIEEETFENLREIASLLNQMKNVSSITYSDVARRLLDRRCSTLVQFLRGKISESVKAADEVPAVAGELDRSEDETTQAWEDFIK